ncbi:putative membrane protein YccC [Kitasatospora sp. MAP12-15]|uniref:FUSC family protein n=1 Tax=unclassified Kitasatospora TaxID=2633591 RepID=UPI002473C96B|nr:FUSC family protein [Kitasatospora sp. MAP12-44]MDH6115571.1 putative membrane protein YccC [Kitasatospora sp. MAP12-44]
MNQLTHLTAWLRRRDPGLAATRRAARTAVVMPFLFAMCTQVFHVPVTGTFAAFGAFAMLLLVEFTGPMAQRLRAQTALTGAWLVLVTLGTLATRSVWTAATATVTVGLAVLFAGVVSSVLASSTTALLLGFILPVSAPAPPGQLPDRLLGVLLAGASAFIAVAVMWPRRATDQLSAPAAQVCRAAAQQLRADADHFEGRATPTYGRCRSCAQQTASSTQRLRHVFTATPYRPTGLSTESRTLVRLVDELTWLSAVLAEAAPTAENGPTAPPQACQVRRTAATVLDLSAEILDDPTIPPARLRAAAEELRGALTSLEAAAVDRLPPSDAPKSSQGDLEAVIDSLDISFRSQEVAFVVLQIAQNLDLARAAHQRGWSDRLLGREPGALTGPLKSAQERAAAHLQPHSVWLHNSVRGAVGLGIGVVAADAAGVQHAFWVLLGTLAVLRSNALSTGQNAFRALGGTLAGSIVGAALLQLIGHHPPVLWALLPIAVMASGIVPSAISFTAGQAAFTLTLVILFNIAQPAGVSVIVVRIEDIALGCAVSLVVGLLFWPRGASAAVGKTLAQAYLDSARYLTGAVDYAVACCTFPPPALAALQDGHRAAASARRLDDAFRTYLAERGAKAVPLGEMTTLVTGVVGLRLAADAVLELWRRSAGDSPPEDRAGARKELLVMADRILRWYQGLAEALVRGEPPPVPLQADRTNNARLLEAVSRDLGDASGRATATGVRIAWTGDHLEAARRLQAPIAAAARDSNHQLAGTTNLEAMPKSYGLSSSVKSTRGSASSQHRAGWFGRLLVRVRGGRRLPGQS